MPRIAVHGFLMKVLGTSDQTPVPGLCVGNAPLVHVHLLSDSTDQRKHCTWGRKRR